MTYAYVPSKPALPVAVARQPVAGVPSSPVHTGTVS